MSRRLMIAVCAIAAIGCGHAPPPASPPIPRHTRRTRASVADAAPVALDDDLPRLAQRAVAMYQEIAARALGDAGDCAAATAKLEAIETSYADVIAANRRVLHGGRDKIRQLHVALEPHQTDFDAAAHAIVQSPTMTTCSHDPAFAHAIDELVGETS